MTDWAKKIHEMLDPARGLEAETISSIADAFGCQIVEEILRGHPELFKARYNRLTAAIDWFRAETKPVHWYHKD